MQTFLPVADFCDSARLLDRARLGKQRSESHGLLTLFTNGKGRNWGALKKLWGDHVFALWAYNRAILDEWAQRGYSNAVSELTWRSYAPHFAGRVLLAYPVFPQALHDSHVAMLLQKNTAHYDPVFRANDIPIPSDWERMSYAWLSPVSEIEAKADGEKLLARASFTLDPGHYP